ncbi:predicted protein [Nematostella vectensis]|uniref:Uncharacterized protein n=1 Tax=Nematostella vectensis TaxID=45351 RepID=A7S796_NEMVE|nr:uncharacterized protein LOC5512206 [Nematostella vectensis]XP_048589709.1 uncharacterized protein LOC5512206 [Nematostella vectensis]EDO40493.1 predicted protein [Nematostella vectensis]|eukprot:XP_001632556.1 predicted protein [Nematostella vectensis]
MGRAIPSRPRSFSLALILASVLLFVLGCLYVGLTVALSPEDVMKATRVTLYSTFWFACVALVTSFIGIIAGLKQTKCPVGSYLIFNIVLSAASALTIFVLVVMAMGNVPLGIDCPASIKKDCRSDLNISFVIGLVATAILTLGCSVLASVLACRSLCKCCGIVAEAGDESEELDPSPGTPVIPLGYMTTPSEDLRVPRLTIPSGMYGSSTDELPLYRPGLADGLDDSDGEEDRTRKTRTVAV